MFYVLRKATTTKVAYFPMFYFHSEFHDTALRGASVTSLSEVATASIFILQVDKLSLVIKHHAMYTGSGGVAPRILILRRD